VNELFKKYVGWLIDGWFVSWWMRVPVCSSSKTECSDGNVVPLPEFINPGYEVQQPDALAMGSRSTFLSALGGHTLVVRPRLLEQRDHFPPIVFRGKAAFVLNPCDQLVHPFHKKLPIGFA